jgi:hypothetical protein
VQGKNDVQVVELFAKSALAAVTRANCEMLLLAVVILGVNSTTTGMFELVRRPHNTRAVVAVKVTGALDCEMCMPKVQIIACCIRVCDNIILAFKLPGNVIEFIYAFL